MTSQLRVVEAGSCALTARAQLFYRSRDVRQSRSPACGEAVDAIQGTYHMVRSFSQRLRNQNPLNVHRIFDQIRKGGVFGGAPSGVFIAVLSAIETALWDLAGKALNVPVYQPPMIRRPGAARRR